MLRGRPNHATVAASEPDHATPGRITPLPALGLCGEAGEAEDAALAEDAAALAEDAAALAVELGDFAFYLAMLERALGLEVRSADVVPHAGPLAAAAEVAECVKRLAVGRGLPRDRAVSALDRAWWGLANLAGTLPGGLDGVLRANVAKCTAIAEARRGAAPPRPQSHGWSLAWGVVSGEGFEFTVGGEDVRLADLDPTASHGVERFEGGPPTHWLGFVVEPDQSREVGELTEALDGGVCDASARWEAFRARCLDRVGHDPGPGALVYVRGP